jgi:hypothetical protein
MGSVNCSGGAGAALRAHGMESVGFTSGAFRGAIAPRGADFRNLLPFFLNSLRNSRLDTPSTLAQYGSFWSGQAQTPSGTQSSLECQTTKILAGVVRET